MKHLFSFAMDVVRLYFAKRVSRSSAELAYFLSLSFFPALICANALIGTLKLDVAAILGSLGPVIPRAALNVLTDYVGYITANSSPALLTAGVVMTLVSASGAMRALMNAMDDLYGRKTYRGVWQVVASVAFSALFLLTVYLSLVVVLTGRWFFRLLEGALHAVPGLAGLVLPWQWMRFVVLFCLVLLFVLLLYRSTAPREGKRPPILTGAFFASAALVVAGAVFSAFIGMSSRYSLVYGSLASVVILLVWLYLCGNILILGNVVNRVRYDRTNRRYDP